MSRAGSSPVTTVQSRAGRGTGQHRSAWLEWWGPSGSGQLSLAGRRIVVGRHPDCQLYLEDSQVSRHHAVLQHQSDGWWLFDQDSSNGTRVNGKPVRRARLRDGDLVRIGASRLKFHEQPREQQALDVTVLPDPDSRPPTLACLELEESEFRPESELLHEDELRREYRRLLTAYRFQTYLGRESNEGKLLENILHFAFEMLPAERGAILLRPAPGAPLVPALALDRSGQQAHLVIPDSILRLALEQQQALLVEDALADLRFARAPSIIGQGVRSVLCVPLPGRQEIIGALHLDTRTATGAFSQRDLQLLGSIATQAATVLEQARLRRSLRRAERRQQRLSRFLPAPVVSELIERGIDLSGSGSTCQVAVLFCDIRSFCSLAESLPPGKLLALLNTFFENMAEVVFAHEGMLDKFIGDALMAVWGAPLPHPDDAARALAAARQMLGHLQQVNAELAESGAPTITAGIGLHYGEAVAGTVGSRRRLEYTVMGETVNLAARLCQAARGGQLLVSAQALAEAGRAGQQPPARRLPAMRLRGVSRAVHVYQVEPERG